MVGCANHKDEKCAKKIIISVSIFADSKKIIWFKRGGYDKKRFEKKGGQE